MKNAKKWVTVIVLITFLCTYLLPWQYGFASSENLNDKAGVLNKLGVLRGDGVDYNLSGQLKRSEAAAFIVRIMGKESYVLSNSDSFKSTSFPDVSSSQWYAPYIGFCTQQSIIGGYPDGNYGPNDYVSEKEFIKLALGALGYIYGMDYNWDNIFQTAYQVGIVTDSKYQTLNEDNLKFTRGDVVNILNNSLAKEIKGIKKTLIKSLVDDGAVTRQTAVDLGLIFDGLKTAIKQVTVVSENKISIKLNENIKPIGAADISITDSQSSLSKLQVTILSQSGDEIVLNTSAQVQGKIYNIEIKNVEDLDGNKVTSVYSNFTGFKKPDGVPTAISQAAAIAENKLSVKLNEKVKSLNQCIVQIYETENKQNKLVAYVESYTEDSIVLTTLKQTPGMDYTIQIYNVEDLEGNKSSVVSTAFTGYKKPDALISAISEVNALAADSIRIKFNEDIKPLDSSSIVVYESANKTSKLSSSVQSQSGSELTLKTAVQTPDMKYSIEIAGVEDTEGYKTGPLTGIVTGYRQAELKSDFFKISKVEAVSKSVINVYFTQPINLNAALPLYYQILDGNNVVASNDFQSMVVKCLNPYNNAVTIFLTNYNLVGGKYYTVKVSGNMTSTYSSNLGEGNGDSIGFVGKGNENEDFYITGIMPVDNKTVEILFNRDVDYSTAEAASNYYIEAANGVPRMVMKATIVNEGERKGKAVQLGIAGTFNTDQTYTVTVRNISDSLLRVTVPETKYPFYGNLPERKDLQIINVTPEDKSVLLVYIDKQLNISSATNASNYIISGVSNPGYTAIPAKVFYDKTNNPYTLKLYLPSDKALSSSDSYKLTINNTMQDDLGNMSLSNAEKQFNGSSADVVKPFMYEAKIIGTSTIKVLTTKEISNEGLNAQAINYSLEYKQGESVISKNPNSVSIVNGTTLILKFDSIDTSRVLTLKFNSLADYGGVNTRFAADGLNEIGVIMGN